MKIYHLISIMLALTGSLILSGCVGSPAATFDKKAKHLGFLKSTISTQLFELAVFVNRPISQIQSATKLHIYLGGDGTPWISSKHKSVDPTPRKQTALNLMAIDTNPAIYVGRPCYHAAKKSQNCNSKWWTSNRYSGEVIEALKIAILQLSNDQQKLTIIGFSGGGTLAMLVAPHLSNIARVITISSNLDIQHWTQRHAFTPLTGSINPAEEPNLPASILTLHLLGAADTNIDAKHIHKQFKNRNNTKVMIYPSYNHHCCWQEIWTDILDSN